MNPPARIRIALVALFGALVVTASARATFPAGFTQTLVDNGLTAPTAMALAPDGRIFVAEQGGTLRVIENGSLLGPAFVSLTVNSTDERGLLGVAFDPGFGTPMNNYVYVYYTATTPNIHNRISRFPASGNVAGGSEEILFDLDPLTATNHNGGAIHFGLDGKLYAAAGENAVPGNAQVLTNLLGKILRINEDGSIPTDNPFYNTASGQNRAIWALGLRNPFTFAVQRGTGRIFINDVGQGAFEEINDGIAGSNYGWPTCEGQCNPPNLSFRDPISGYADTPNCDAITGGAFYNPTTVQFPAEYVGDYFFGDYCRNFISRIDLANPGNVIAFGTNLSAPVDVAVASNGSLYYASIGAGAVYRVTGPPTAVAAASFGARRTAKGVLLTWRADVDLRILGFNVFRGPTRLNRALIVSPRHSFLDRMAPRVRARYRLQVVLADGSRAWAGSIAVSPATR